MTHVQKKTYKSARTGKVTTSWQARYSASDGRERTKRFRRQVDAEKWATAHSADVNRGAWIDPNAGKITFRVYSDEWLNGRELRPTTKAKYRYLLDKHILPTFGDTSLSGLTPSQISAWRIRLGTKHQSTAAGAYRLLSTICRTAIDEERIYRSPCRVKGGATEKAAERPVVAIADLERAVAACPSRYRLALLLAAWCQLRRGEIVGLQRQDINLKTRTLTISRSWCVPMGGPAELGPPKTEAGRRDVTIPPNVVPQLQKHLATVTTVGPESWLFPADGDKPISPRTLDRAWETARDAIGRKDIRLHDLRHTGLTLAAATGATTAELMKRGGHSSPAAALRYQHATADGDRVLADALGNLAKKSNVIQLRRTKDGRKSKPESTRPAV
jgi:integrase